MKQKALGILIAVAIAAASHARRSAISRFFLPCRFGAGDDWEGYVRGDQVLRAER